MLLNDFEERTLQMPPDYEGRVTATLLNTPAPEAGRPAVLYIHGYNDYFFQAHVAKAFRKHGYDFYALDLRKYGRSLMEHQHPNYCRSLDEYFPEITESLRIICREHPGQPVYLVGHSTGGLIAALYANRGPDAEREVISGLILNSPFLDFKMKPLKKSLILLAARLISRIFPYAGASKPLSHLYARSLHRSADGEWEYNLDWKPRRGFKAYFKWLTAVHTGQQYLRNHSDLQIPVLLMHSSDSLNPSAWNGNNKKADMVLDVRHMIEHGDKLGTDVTFVEVEHAIHDIFLSAGAVRERAYKSLFTWLADN